MAALVNLVNKETRILTMEPISHHCAAWVGAHGGGSRSGFRAPSPSYPQAQPQRAPNIAIVNLVNKETRILTMVPITAQPGGTWRRVAFWLPGTVPKLNHKGLPTSPSPDCPAAVLIHQAEGEVVWIPPGWLHAVDMTQPYHRDTAQIPQRHRKGGVTTHIRICHLGLSKAFRAQELSCHSPPPSSCFLPPPPPPSPVHIIA